MAQQINLCPAVSAPLQQRFAAKVMLGYWIASFVLLALVAGFWLWNLDASAKTYSKTLDLQAREISNLQAAIDRGRAAASPVDPALLRALQDEQALVLQREKILLQVSQGIYQPGAGHSDRLQLLARSIPADTWITGVKADSAAFAVAGYTLDTGSLNDWVARLGQHPLLRNLQLDTVAVSLVPDAAGAPAKPTASASAPVLQARPSWSFSVVSVAAAPALLPATVPVAPVASAVGAKP